MGTATINQYFGKNNAPPIQSIFDLIAVSRAGISKKAVATMAKNLTVNQDQLLAILHISRRTWQRYKDEQLLPQDVSERALQLARLYEQGEDTFGIAWKFQGWINQPSLLFGGERPIDLLNTQFGFEAVRDELIRIDWGVLV